MTKTEWTDEQIMDFLDVPLTAKQRSLIASVYYGLDVYQVPIDSCYEVPCINEFIRAAYSDRVYQILEIEDDFIYVLEIPDNHEGEIEDYTFDWSNAELIE